MPSSIGQARILQRHLWRWRLDSRQDFGGGHGNGGRGPDGCASSVLHRRNQGLDSRIAGRCSGNTISAESLHCAAICRRAWSMRASFAMPAIWSSLCAQQTGDWFHIEVAAYPEVHPQARSPQADLDAFMAKVNAGSEFGDNPVFLQRRCLFPVPRRCLQG